MIANLVNLVGVILLVMSHTILSVSESKSTYILSILGGTIVIVGSLILKSYPPVVLNVFWVLISILGLLKRESLTNEKPKRPKVTLLFILLIPIIILLLGYFYLVEIEFVDLISMATAFIYSAAYLSLTLNLISKKNYLLLCLLGFVLFIPHLIDKLQLTLLVNEIYGAAVAFFGIVKIHRKQI